MPTSDQEALCGKQRRDIARAVAGCGRLVIAVDKRLRQAISESEGLHLTPLGLQAVLDHRRPATPQRITLFFLSDDPATPGGPPTVPAASVQTSAPAQQGLYVIKAAQDGSTEVSLAEF
jgi:hypothetical protein